MIDLSNETLFTFPDAAKRLPGRPHVSTLHRWRLRGVKLEAILVGGKRLTSAEALQRFAEATTAAANGEAPPTRTAAQRQRAIRKAEQELAADGSVASTMSSGTG